MQFFGYDIDDKNVETMMREDRSESTKGFRNALAEIEAYRVQILDEVVEDAHAIGIKDFVPDGYSIAQAVAARASTMATTGMIIYDFDGMETPEGLLSLVKEAYYDLVKAVICTPEMLLGGSGLKDNLSPYEKEHGYHFMSCTMLGEPDWSDCSIPYDEYALEEGVSDSHGNLTSVSEAAFVLFELRKRASQYLSYGTDGFDEVTAGNVLYETTQDGQSQQKLNERAAEEQLSDEAYEDVHGAASKALMYAMVECEGIIAESKQRDMRTAELKDGLRRVHSHLRWFFDYYHDKRVTESEDT